MTQEQQHGIVMEVHKRSYIIMTDQGTFIKVKKKKNEVRTAGEKITIPCIHSQQQARRRTPTIRIAAILITIFLIVTTTTMILSRPAEASYAIVMHINPSVEVKVDKDLQVLEVEPLNAEAEQLLKSMQFENSTLYNFSNQFIHQSILSGFLSKSATIHSSIVALDDRTITFQQELSAALSSQLETEAVQAEVDVKQISKETYQILTEEPVQSEDTTIEQKQPKPLNNNRTNQDEEATATTKIEQEHQANPRNSQSQNQQHGHDKEKPNHSKATKETQPSEQKEGHSKREKHKKSDNSYHPKQPKSFDKGKQSNKSKINKGRSNKSTQQNKPQHHDEK